MRETNCLLLLATVLACTLQKAQTSLSDGIPKVTSTEGRRSGEQAADDVDRYISKSMTRQHIPGLSLVVIRDGVIVKARGYGLASLELSVPAKSETVYELASATKPLVANAIMLLVQDRKLDLGRQD